MDTGSCQASCIDRVYMCWQIGIDIGVSISIGADVYTNSDTLGGTVFSEAVPLFFLCFGSMSIVGVGFVKIPPYY